MSTLAKVLSELATEHVNVARSEHRDCRLIFPGLTGALARDLHRILTEQLRSIVDRPPVYLVLDDPSSDPEPDESDRRLYYEALTSVRQGSFIAICMPRVLPKLQDSIRGSGGPIRSLAFEDDWPWNDTGAEAFRFGSPVLPRLLESWSDKPEEKRWLEAVILDGFLPATSPLPDSARIRLLVQETLNSFDPDANPELESVLDKFFFHCGIPRISKLNSWNARRYAKSVSQLATKVRIQRRRTDSFRMVVIDRAKRMFEGRPDWQQLREALHLFLDGIFDDSIDHGLLAFHRALGPLSTTGSISHWTLLDLDLLSAVFDPSGRNGNGNRKPFVRCRVSIDSGHGVLSEDRKHAALFEGDSLTVDVFLGNFEHVVSPKHFSVRCKLRRSIVWDSECQPPEMRFSLSNLPCTRTRTPYLVQLLQFNQVISKDRVYVYICGDRQRGLVVLQPRFDYVYLEPSVESEPDPDPIELKSPTPVTLHVLDWMSAAVCRVAINDGSVPILGPTHGERHDCCALYSLPDPIDPQAHTENRADVRIEASGLGREITLVGGRMRFGECTLEDEFRVAAASSGYRSARLARVQPFFQGGDNLILPQLCQPDEQSARRMALARFFESESGWKPVVVDFLHPSDWHSRDVVDDCCCRSIGIRQAFWREAQPSNRVSAVLTKYQLSRSLVLKTAKEYVGSYRSTSERPTYVVAPIFVEESADAMASALVGYLSAYVEVLSLLHEEPLQHHEVFTLVHLDSVVLDDGGLKRSSLNLRMSLMGPWHPLVVAKRYMVQDCILRAVQDRRPASRAHRRLVPLFERVDAFRVVPGFSPNTGDLGISFAFPTSDPGWHVVLNGKAFEGVRLTAFRSLRGLGQQLRGAIGLQSSFYPVGSELWSDSFVKAFLRSHPSRRQLTLRVGSGLDGRQIAESCARILEEDGTDGIPLGTLVPGGIHILLKEKLNSRAPFQWEEPTIFVYEGLCDTQCFKSFNPDIMLLPQGKEPQLIWPSARSGVRVPTPRGVGSGAVFTFPVVQLVTSRRTGLPEARVFENGGRGQSDNDQRVYDGLGSTSVGSWFLNALDFCDKLAALVAPQRPAFVQELALPKEFRCDWTVLAGADVDAGALTAYLVGSNGGGSGAGNDRSLWDYRIDLSDSVRSYFVLCRVPRSAVVALRRSGLSLTNEDISSVLREVTKVGFAVGDTMRSGKAAVGVVGVVGALRILAKAWACGRADRRKWCTVLLPVDCFTDLIAPQSEVGKSARRGDLLALHLAWNLDGEPELVLSLCAVECKYVSGVFAEGAVSDGLSQAKATFDVVDRLVHCALAAKGMHCRLALGRLLRFGLRLLSARGEVKMEDEQVVLDAILSGSFALEAASAPALLVSTSCRDEGATRVETLAGGWWVRLTRESWPRKTPSMDDDAVRKIASFFSRHERQRPEPDDGVGDAGCGLSTPLPQEADHLRNASGANSIVPESSDPASSTAEEQTTQSTNSHSTAEAGREAIDDMQPRQEAVHAVFRGFVGNEPAVEALSIQLLYAETTGGHTLRPIGLFGPKSTGKTELARRVAKALSVPELFLSETSLGNIDQLAKRMQRRATEAGHPMRTHGVEGGLTILRCSPMVVFIDEVHQLSTRVQDALLPVFESDDRMLRGSRVIIDARDVSFIVATTDWGKLREAFRSRVRPISLRAYTAREVSTMLRLRIGLQSGGGENPGSVDPVVTGLGEEALVAIATAARAVPRVAIDLLREIGMAIRIGRCDTSPEQVRRHLQRLVPCDHHGLTPQDHKYLRLVATRSPIGLNSIAVALGTDQSNVTGAIEPFFIQMGWVRVASSGRTMTPKGRQFFHSL